MRRPIASLTWFATLSFGAAACTAILGNFEEGTNGTPGDADTGADGGNSPTDASLDTTYTDAAVLSDAPNDSESNSADASDASIDSGPSLCLPAVCASGSLPQNRYCFDFENLDGGIPKYFTGGPVSGYVQSKAPCGEALSLMQMGSAGFLTLTLPTSGSRTSISFDLYVSQKAGITMPGGGVDFAYVYGPTGKGDILYPMALKYQAFGPALSIRNVPGAAEKSTTLPAGMWCHVSVDVTLAQVSVDIEYQRAFDIALPAGIEDGGFWSPTWLLGAVSPVTSDFEDVRIDNLAVITTP